MSSTTTANLQTIDPSEESRLPNIVEGQIDSVESISPVDFLNKYIRQCRPVVITGMMQAWPAMQKWSFEYFRDLAVAADSDATVHLEEGNVMQDNTSFRKQGFSEYIQQLLNDLESKDRKAYLSVFKLFDHFPDLRNDVDFSLLDQHKLKSSSVGWIGPAGTVTGYHIDWGDNILAQMCGRKCIHLAAPSAMPNMHVSQKFDQGTTISNVDLHNWDAAAHPNFSKVVNHKIVLQPGHMVFIPRGWWHHVQSVDKSISVSNIAYDVKGIVADVLPHRLKQKLHNAGIWKCDCTCHVIKDGKWVRK